MSKRLKSASMLLLLMGASTGAAYAVANPGVTDVKITQQNGTCTGVVKDATGETVIGASVVVKGTTHGTITGIDGDFSLSGVKQGDVIVVSFVGCMTQEIVWKGQPVNVTLKDDAKSLGEVVVTALGMKREAKALGYAMKEMKGDELNANLINPVSALQGKVAGVQIENTEAGMFGSTKILIRGASTLGKNNQPIYVVDGVILDNGIYDGDPDYADNSKDYGNELKNLNPDDFATVSVLKGAAATALYGSRGLNGAVVITTKSGKGKKGIGVEFSQTIGLDVLTSTPNLQNEFGNGSVAGYVSYGDKDANGNYYTYDSYGQFAYNSAGKHTSIGMNGSGYGPAFDGSEIEYYDGTYRSYRAVKNNFRDAYDTGVNTNTNLTISGGNDRTTFYTSMSYKYAKGTVPNNTFERVSLLAKASHKITDKVSLDASISFANSKPRNSQKNLGQYFATGTWSRDYDTKYSKKKYKGVHGGLASTSYGDEYGNMPGRSIWWDIYENDYTQKETSVRPSLKLNVDILDWLKFNAEGNYNYYYTRYEDKQPGQGYANDGGYYGMGMTSKEQTNLNANFLFNKQFGDFAVNGFLRGEYYHNFQQAMSLETQGGLIIPNQYFIENSKDTPKYSGKISGEKTMLSVAFQAGISWKDQIYVDVTGRNDWSSSLLYSDTHGNFSYFYPSISGSWLLHQTFRESLPQWISFMKIRGSWAQVGNDTDAYIINSAYTLNTSTVGSDKIYGTEIPSQSYTQNLKPEKKTSWEVGLDWRFLENRIGLDFTYYKENTKNQIMTIDVPYQSGLSKQLVNAGNIQNSGVEIALNTVPIRTNDFEWNLDLTYTKNSSKIISLHENVADYIALSGSVAYGNFRIGSVAKVGSEYGLLMTDSNVGRDEASGLPIIVWTDSRRGGYYLRSGEVQEIGSMMPDFLGSVSTGLKYKNWRLNIGLDMRFGGYVASYASRYGTSWGYTERSLDYAPGHGGITWTSAYDGVTYHDGVIPEGIIQAGTTITQPNGEVYTVAGSSSMGGELYADLVKKGVLEPTHASYWTDFNNEWTMDGRKYGVVNDAWVKKLNYIALREIALSYSMPSSICQKIRANHINLTLAGHNLGYLLNTMPNGENPESVRGTTASEFRVRSFEGVTSNFTLTVNVGF